jgi:uncharacterized repeat protein (TIGR01451 family)
MPNVRRLTTLLWLIPTLMLAAEFSVRSSQAQLPEIPTLPSTLPPASVPPPASPLPDPKQKLDQPAPVDIPPVTRQATALPPQSIPVRPNPEAPSDPKADRASSPVEVEQKDGPLPPAKDRAPGAAVPTMNGPADGYTLPADRLPVGRQTLGLSVEVIAPAVMNVGHAASIKIMVKNTGVADASAVRVRYDLPTALELVTSQPEQQRTTPDDPMLFWVLNTLAAGSEQIITLKVKPKEVSTIDHTALVTLMVGGRSRTVIQKPELMVEMPPPTPRSVLKGQQATFRISVTNPGSGPARDVLIQAKLSSGLRVDGAGGSDSVDQTIAILQPKETVELDALIVDTVAGGDQTCTVTASSRDVTTDGKKTQALTVLRPELALTLEGPTTRYTDTIAEYRVNVTNPGTAAAKKVRVTVTLPANSGKLGKPWPAGATWDPATQKLSWVIANIEPARAGEPGRSVGTFNVRLGGPGIFRVAAEARAGQLAAKDLLNTSVSGFANISLNVTETKKIIDVGETTIYEIQMKNIGTKEAKNLLISAKLSPNVEIMDVAGVDAEASIDKKTDELRFPVIESLAPGRELSLSVRVKAVKSDPGTATCRVFLMHDDIKDLSGRLEDIANTGITGDPGVRRK